MQMSDISSCNNYYVTDSIGRNMQIMLDDIVHKSSYKYIYALLMKAFCSNVFRWYTL